VEAAFNILGPLQVLVDDTDVTPRAPKERALLALLLVSHGRVVAVDRLVEDLWPGETFDRARRIVQVRVAALRKRLSCSGTGGVLNFVPPGYRLATPPESMDVDRFSARVEQGRRQRRVGQPADAANSLRTALALWRGAPLEDVQACTSLENVAVRLAQDRLDALEECLDADLACGRHQSVVSELEELVTENPLRERFWELRILALYRCGRQAEALRACSQVRRFLIDELGVEPRPELRALETAVLEQRPELGWSAKASVHPLDETDDVPASAAAAPRLRASVAVTGSEGRPAIRYARGGDGVHIAYQVVGDGPLDLIVVPGYVSHLDNWWQARSGRLVRRLSRFCRLILFDKRGTGLSDRPSHIDVEQWVDDTRVVLDAVGSARPVIVGVSAGGPIAILFAASYPERTRSLVLYGAFARELRDEDDYPFGLLPEAIKASIEYIEPRWGTGVGLSTMCPSAGDDPTQREHYGRYQRASASPGAASNYLRALSEVDVRSALPMVKAPTLVLHAARDRVIPIELARYMADRIPHAALVELDSSDHLIWFSDAVERITDEIEHFVTEREPEQQETSRVLATVALIELLGQPQDRLEHAIEPGWLFGDGTPARQLLHRFRGEPVAADDGALFITFDGPARGIRCTVAILQMLSASGAMARAGIHCGECDVLDGGLRGAAVEIARQVTALGAPGDVLVSQTLPDLVVGSAITFDHRGCHTLGEVPGRWHVFAVTDTRDPTAR
jgi:DNA-binding SARP family transcriptional activator/pimeloyl-ACP methyl ester carboxylesterase